MIRTITLFSLLMLGNFAFAQNCLQNFTYGQAVTVSNPNATALTDHEIKITVNTAALVTAGKMESDGRDMRFTSTACCDILPHYIESGMNTSATEVWVRVPNVPAMGSETIYMDYGNPGAVNTSSEEATFSFWDGFDGPTMKFTNPCGSGGSHSITAGNLVMNWSSNYMLISDSIFQLSSIYTAEMDVVAANGNWPGIYWSRNSDQRSYAMLMGQSQVRIGVSGSGSGYCTGMNWANTPVSMSNPVGLWSITWAATGSQFGEFPGVGTVTSTNSLYAKTAPLRLCLGGISGGSGGISINWVRARKYSASAATAAFGSEFLLPSPSVTMGADTTICANATLNIDAGSGWSSTVWNTGDTTQMISVSMPGPYSVVVADSVGCEASDTLVLSNFPAITLDLGADTIVCSNAGYTLDAGAGLSAYMWNTGDMTQTLAPTTTGPFSVVVTDGNGCTETDTAYVTINAAPTPSFSGVLAICSGNAITLDPGTFAASYNWNTGDTSQTTTASTAGLYTVTVSGNNGCTEIATANVLASNGPSVAFSNSANLLVIDFTDMSTGAVSWAWDFGDSNSDTQQNPTHTYAAAGSYVVCLTATDSLGCTATMCDTLDVIAVGIQNPTGPSIRLFPIPANDFVQLNIHSDVSSESTVMIADLQGKVLFTEAVPASADQSLRISTNEMAAGVYMVTVQNEMGRTTHKLIVE